jgi:aminoglycoside phosphotransferase (APT) family kinase protein
MNDSRGVHTVLRPGAAGAAEIGGAADAELREDPKLPLVGLAWAPAELGELLNRHVLPAISRDDEVTGVAIEQLSYTPGIKCTGLYSLRFGESPNASTGRAVVSFAKRAKLREIHSRHYGDTEPTDRPISARAVLLPELRCLVELFPSDWGLLSLARAMEAAEVASMLSPAGTRPSESLPEVEVLRYKPHRRCVLRYGLESGAGRREVVGKVYRPGQRAAEAWRTLAAAHARERDDSVVIPAPLRLVRGWDLVLMEHVAGSPMEQVLEGTGGPRRVDQAAQLAATALTTLHQLPLRGSAVRLLEHDLQVERKRAAPLQLVAPLLARQVETLLDRIALLVERTACPVPTAIHGDFAPSQLMLDGERAAVVDFDTVCLGDPAIDVGNFAAESRRLALTPGQSHVRQLATQFIAECRARGVGDGIVERARLYEAIALVRMAISSFQRSPRGLIETPRRSLPILLLREAAACLEEL